MHDPRLKLDIFIRIPNEKIIELGNFFDYRILYKSADIPKLEQILGNDFGAKDISEIVQIFTSFVTSKRDPDKIFEIINTLKLNEDKKKILKETIQKIHNKTDLNNISLGLNASFLKSFGHSHIHGFTTVTEFRPISNNDGITKIIPSLIVSIITHESNDDKVVNFQLSLKEVEKLIDELNNGADSLKTEIRDFCDKFGDDVLD